MESLSRTFSPWTLGGLELPHRVVMGSMHTGLEVLDDGGAALAEYFAERVRGGAALVTTGGLAVSPEGRGGGDYGVLGEERGDARLRRAVEAVHEAGGRIAAQLFHAGRYAVLDGMLDPTGAPLRAVAPSPLPWSGAGPEAPVELDEVGIRRVLDEFRAGAARAAELGFDVVEVMASEGYLVNQFCSPVTNLRDDEWGGDPERRRRFAVEVVRAVRTGAGPEVPVIVRMSGADLVPGSSSQEDVDELARALVAVGADALNIGIGWHESRVPTVQAAVPHGLWLRYAEAVARAVARDPVPVIASNRLTDLRDAEAVLARGTVTAVSLARPFLADPELVARSRRGDFASVNSCIGCNQACIDRSLTMRSVSCLVNPRAGRETRYPIALSRRPGRFAVVGAGPAGLVAATDLAERGHRVTLFEADDELGGQFRWAARIPTKEDYGLTVDHYARRLEHAGAAVETGHAATAEELVGFDGVVVATGVRPRPVELPGADLPHVLSYEQAIRDGVPDGRVAIVGGGGIGVDVAKLLVLARDPAERAREFERRFALAGPSTFLEGALPQRRPVAALRMRRRPGEQVTLLRRSGRFGAGMGITSRWVAIGELRDAGVEMLSGLAYRRITPDGVEVRLPDGVDRLIPADVVIVCAGQLPHDPLSANLAVRGIRHEVVGGALDASGVDAVRATTQGLDAARRLAAGA